MKSEEQVSLRDEAQGKHSMTEFEYVATFCHFILKLTESQLLYDLDVESDRLAIIQSLLLMSFWSATPGDSKGGWHWMGIAVSLGLTIGIHRKLDDRGYNVKERRLRRRIWWSCYIRDRLLALGMSRPMRIRDGEFDTPMLTLADFDIDELEPDHVAHLDSSIVEIKVQRRLAEMCIKMAELCTHIGPVLSLHFSFLPADDSRLYVTDQIGQTTALLFASNQSFNIEDVQAYDQKLQDLLLGLPESSIYRSANSADQSASSLCIMHAALLQIVFFSVVSALHRPLLNAQGRLVGDPCELQEFRTLSQCRVYEAAKEVSKMNHEVHSHEMDGYLLPTAVTLQLPAIITHLKRLQSSSKGVTEILTSLFHCLSVLERLQAVYVGADLVMAFALEIMKGTGITSQIGQNSKINGLIYKGQTYSADSFQPYTMDGLLPTQSEWVSGIQGCSETNLGPFGAISNNIQVLRPMYVGNPTPDAQSAKPSPLDNMAFDDCLDMLIGFDSLQNIDLDWVTRL